MVLFSTGNIIAIIVSIALVAVTLAVCLYLYSLKTKSSSIEEEAPEDPTVSE